MSAGYQSRTFPGFTDEECLKTPLLPGLFGVDVVTMPNGRTYWVELVCDASNLPEQLIADLGAAGFAERGKRLPSYPMGGTQIQDIELSREGSGPFKSWTKEEQKENIKTLRAIFKRHGIVGLRPRKKDIREML